MPTNQGNRETQHFLSLVSLCSLCGPVGCWANYSGLCIALLIGMLLWRHMPRAVRNGDADKQPSKPAECCLQRWRAQEGLRIILRVLLDFRVFFFWTDLKVGFFSGSVNGGWNTDGVEQLLPLIFRQQSCLILEKFWSSVSWLPTALKVVVVCIIIIILFKLEDNFICSRESRMSS